MSRQRHPDKTGICVYCGFEGTVTRDHIPPKGLFPEPRPNNLITVPCCHECNNGHSFDDEYFRLVLILRWGAYYHPDFPDRYLVVKRALQRAEKQTFTQDFIAKIEKVRIKLPDQEIETGVFRPDFKKIKRVVSRTTRGLFYREYDRMLSLDAKIRVFVDHDLMRPEFQNFDAFERIRSAISAAVPNTIGQVVEYRHVASEDNPDASAWYFKFYNSTEFLCLTIPSGEPPANELAAE